jgi:hypothetical protein
MCANIFREKSESPIFRKNDTKMDPPNELHFCVDRYNFLAELYYTMTLKRFAQHTFVQNCLSVKMAQLSVVIVGLLSFSFRDIFI